MRAAQDDDYTIGSRTISHTASGGGFNVTDPVVLTASEMDDEASFLFTNADGDAIAGLTVPEGGSADYYVALSTPPASAVQVTLAATGDISVSPSLVIFTTANWDTAQKVTASAAEEAPAQPSATNRDNTVNEEETITHTAASGDAVYNGKTIALAATGQDNDPGIVIRNAADDAYVTELDVREGGSAAYTVKLNSPPPRHRHHHRQDHRARQRPGHHRGHRRQYRRRPEHPDLHRRQLERRPDRNRPRRQRQRRPQVRAGAGVHPLRHRRRRRLHPHIRGGPRPRPWTWHYKGRSNRWSVPGSG